MSDHISIIHAADLHLGAPFKGIAQGEGGFPADIKKRLLKATADSWSRLINLCLVEKPLALLLAGDLYNPEGNGLSSLNLLQDGFTRLTAAGIAVLVVHGNHDPAEIIPPWSWPENVYIFDSQKTSSIPINCKHNQAAIGPAFDQHTASEIDFTHCKLVVHGLSHQHDRVSDNLAQKVAKHSLAIREMIPTGIPCVGLVHCAVGEKASKGEMPYAPCTISDLREGGLDYWALGHIHKRNLVADKPVAYYSGNLQGLHIKETGPKGCLQVWFDPLKNAGVKFHCLAPLEWLNINFEVKQNSSIDQLQAELLKEIKARFNERRLAKVEGLIIRLILTGRSNMHSWLHKNASQLQAELQAQLPNNSEFVWIKDMLIETAPMADVNQLMAANTLLGEVLREISKAEHMDEAMLKQLLLNTPQTPLGHLYESGLLKKLGLSAPDYQELKLLLQEATLNCLDLLHDNKENPSDLPEY